MKQKVFYLFFFISIVASLAREITSLPKKTNFIRNREQLIAARTIVPNNGGHEKSYTSPLFPRIVGGTETAEGEFPWQVQLVMEYLDDDYCKCGGSLIDEQWVLTAAHCVDKATVVYVVLGAHRGEENGYIDSNAEYYNVSNYVMHPTWNPRTFDGDVAVVKLPTPVEFTDRIRPINLEANDLDLVNERVAVSGWGRTSDSDSSPVLMKTTTNVISNEQCSISYGDRITDNHICTNGADRHNVCHGDSGGPLSFVSADGTHTQVGIVSFGSLSGCLAGHPDVYSRISRYYDWISSETKLPTQSGTFRTTLYSALIVFCAVFQMWIQIFNS